MKIETGLFDGMVMQRTGRDRSDQAVTGRTSATGRVIVTVREGRHGIDGLVNVPAGKADGSALRARIRGVPVGGPYSITLQVEGCSDETLVVRDVLVGDVWALAGQSNMEGIGWLQHALEPHGDVRAFYMTDRWDVARDPLHQLDLAVDPVHEIIHGGTPERSSHVGVGMGLAFARDMRARTGIPQGLIPCAHGGTSMGQWRPVSRDDGGTSLYGATLRRIRKNGGKIAGILWHQGCSDAGPPATRRAYTKRMQKLIAAFRKDLAAPRLPVVAGQIARVVEAAPGASPGEWNGIQEQQRKLPGVIPNLLVVPSIDLDLDDGIHIAGYDQHRLGERYAQAMLCLTKGAKAGKKPIELSGVRVESCPATGNANIVVSFRNVEGNLWCSGRPWGFALVKKGWSGGIFRVDLKATKAIIRTVFPMDVLGTRDLHYGYGRDPYCNITDEADRSLPVFGPVRVGGAEDG